MYKQAISVEICCLNSSRFLFVAYDFQTVRVRGFSPHSQSHGKPHVVWSHMFGCANVLAKLVTISYFRTPKAQLRETGVFLLTLWGPKLNACVFMHNTHIFSKFIFLMNIQISIYIFIKKMNFQKIWVLCMKSQAFNFGPHMVSKNTPVSLS